MSSSIKRIAPTLGLVTGLIVTPATAEPNRVPNPMSGPLPEGAACGQTPDPQDENRRIVFGGPFVVVGAGEVTVTCALSEDDELDPGDAYADNGSFPSVGYAFGSVPWSKSSPVWVCTKVSWTGTMITQGGSNPSDCN